MIEDSSEEMNKDEIMMAYIQEKIAAYDIQDLFAIIKYGIDALEKSKPETPHMRKEQGFLSDSLTEEEQEDIMQLYVSEGADIMTIGRLLNVEPRVILSLLQKNKIITKRMEARGYKAYRNSDAYKTRVRLMRQNPALSVERNVM